MVTSMRLVIYLSFFFICLPSAFSYQKHHHFHSLNHTEFIQDPTYQFDPKRNCTKILSTIADKVGCESVLFDQGPWYQFLSELEYNCESHAPDGVCYGLAFGYIHWKASSGIRGKKTADYVAELIDPTKAKDWGKRVCEDYNQDQGGDKPIESYEKQDLPYTALDTPVEDNWGLTWYHDKLQTKWQIKKNDQFDWDFRPLFTYYAKPTLITFYCEDKQHTFAILNTRTKFRFFDANAGIISCSTIDVLIDAVHQYLHDDTIFAKYTAHRDNVKLRGVELDVALDRVYIKTGVTKTKQQTAGIVAYKKSEEAKKEILGKK